MEEGKGRADRAGAQSPLVPDEVFSGAEAYCGGGGSGGNVFASDTRLGQEAPAQLEGSGPLLADSGFDGGEVWARVEEKVRDEQRKKSEAGLLLGPLPVTGRRGVRGADNKDGLWFPSGGLASYGPEAGPFGGGGLQPP
ncbi:MAG: hypothetical protein DRJ64_03590, partial [Thermoprotei archaeon]